MRKVLWFAAAAAMFVLPASGAFAQGGQPQQAPQPASATPPPAPSQDSSQQDSIAAAARKARDQKKEAPKAAKVFDNDSIPTTGGVSTVGAASAPGQPGDNAAAPNASSSAASGNDEKSWRDKFASLHHKLDQDQAELSVLQRELGVSDVQFYSDPMKGLQQELTRDEIYKKTLAIDAKKKEIEADKQAISDAEDALRKAGGDSGWAR
jgi:hypothetical protein